jgi:hypothetical protein
MIEGIPFSALHILANAQLILRFVVEKARISSPGNHTAPEPRPERCERWFSFHGSNSRRARYQKLFGRQQNVTHGLW